MITIDSLPSELILMIFKNLSVRDLLSMRIVSKHCNSIATDRKLWENFSLRIEKDDSLDRTMLLSLLEKNHISQVEVAQKNYWNSQEFKEFVNDLLEVLANNINLKHLVFKICTDYIDSNLFEKVISNVETLEIHYFYAKRGSDILIN